MKPLNDALFSSDLWKPALEKYAGATHVTVKLFDTDLRVVFGPIHPTPLFEIFDRAGYDPGLFAECARQCLEQTTERPAVTVSKAHGLAVIGTSLVLNGNVVGAAVAGYVLVDFSQFSEIVRVAKDARIEFEMLWQVAREQSPVSQQRLTLNGDLLQALGDALLRENARTREYENTALQLLETTKAKEIANQKLLETALVLKANEEQLERELSAAQQLQSASAMLLESGNSQALYRKVVEAAAAIMASDMASIQRLFPARGAGGELGLLAFQGFDPGAAKFWEWVRADSKSSCGAVLATGARVVVPDVEKCDFMAGTADEAMYRQAGIRAVQSTPLLSRSGRLLGVISTHWRVPHTPAERDLRFFDVLARQAADLIERNLAEDQLLAKNMELADSNREVADREVRYRTLFDLSPVAVYSCDASGLIRDFNHVAVDLWGRTPRPEDTGERWCGSFKMLRPDGTFMPHEQCLMAEVLSGKVPEVCDAEVQVERPDGSRVTILVNIRPLKNENGEITGAINCFVDITERKKTEESLREAKRTLETRVKERTSELEARNAEVLAQSGQLQELSIHLMRAQDEERRRISRELHDSLGQYLTAAKMFVQSLKRPKATSKESRDFQQAVDALDKCFSEARTLSYLLHPPVLEALGFSAAAKWYVEGFSERSGIHVNVNIADEPKRLPEALELALFRIMQESLANVHRHSKSESVDIRLKFIDNRLVLEVKDHGQGMPSELLERFKSKKELAGGVGLRSMSGRIRDLGGSFEIESGKNGTLIRVTAPVTESPAKSELAFESAARE